MATFGLAPMLGAFPPPASEDFPNFIQFRSAGVDLGGRDADTVDFVGGVVTRGTGDNSGVVTVDLSSFTYITNEGGVTYVTYVTNEGGTTVVENVRLGGLTWREAPNDTVLVVGDADNGVVSTGTTGMQSITVPADTGDVAVDLPTGSCVVIFQEGAANLEIHAESGVALLYRADVFAAASAGQYGTMTLIKRAANTWLLCGDMELL